MVYNFYSCCKLVDGAKFSIICDFQRNMFRKVPVKFSRFLQNYENVNLTKIKLQISNEDWKLFHENLLILEKEEILHFTEVPNDNVPIKENWECPSSITNAIIDINRFKGINFVKIWKLLEEVHCEFVQVRIYCTPTLKNLTELLSSISNSRILSLELLIENNNQISDLTYISLLSYFPRIFYIIICSSDINRAIYSPPKNNNGFILRTMEKLLNEKCCGNIGLSNFDINYKVFCESISYNTCLNRKVSIDVDGNIKNCPSMKESFGNIKDTSLAEAIEKPGFKKYWNFSKDKIHVCKDCEFRLICTDCRAYVEDPEDILSKPLKCGYNPYTGEWNEWSISPIKQKAIEFYGLRNIVEEMNLSKSK